METSTLRQSLLTHHADPRTRGEWALSVAALPSKTPAEIVAAATFIKHGVVRTAVAADLVDAGYAVVEDGLPHSLIVFNDEPSPGTLLELKAMFKNEVPNPYAKERRSRDHR